MLQQDIDNVKVFPASRIVKRSVANLIKLVQAISFRDKSLAFLDITIRGG